MAKFAGLLIALGLVVSVSAAHNASADPQERQLPAKRIKIGKSTYLAGDVGILATRFLKNPSIKLVVGLVRQCRSARLWAFVSTQRVDAGVVGWVPTSLFGCIGTSGGGPSRSPCLQAFRTPRNQDPTGVGMGTQGRHYVLIAATSTQTCADLSTQAPGGVWARTSQAIRGLAKGSIILVKCQLQTADGLLDYVAPHRNALPASKPAFWIWDLWVETGFERLEGVPSCSGVSF